MFYFISAALKIISIDSFEIYLYSLHMLPFGGCFLLARAVIIGEILLGALLLSNKFHRASSLLNLGTLLGFTIFLCLLHLSGSTDSCHCMGDAIPFSPLQSILKNGILILLSLGVWKYADDQWRPRWWMALPMVLVPYIGLVVSGIQGWTHMLVIDAELLGGLALCIIAIEVLSSLFLWKYPNRKLWNRRWWLILLLGLAPVGWVAAITTTPEDWSFSSMEYPYDTEILKLSQAPNAPLEGLCEENERKVVAFYSLYCSYCQSACKKMEAIRESNHLDPSLFINIFPGDSNTSTLPFYGSTGTPQYEERIINNHLFISITRGRFPLILLMEGDSVYTTMSTNLSEKKIVEFLNRE